MTFSGFLHLNRFNWVCHIDSPESDAVLDGVHDDLEGVHTRRGALQGHWLVYGLVISVVGLHPFDARSSSEFYQSPGTKRMAERLEEMAKGADPLNNQFLNVQRAAYFRHQMDRALAQPASPSAIASVIDLRSKYTDELLKAGRSLQAIEELDRLEQLCRESGRLTSKDRAAFLHLRSVAYLRMGEQENCLAHHTVQSCLFPIREGGFHKLQRGSRGAIDELTKLLTSLPNDLRARWLLNISYMTVGEYPDKVPPRWVIPPDVFKSDYDIQRFPDVAGDLGLDLDTLAGGVVLEDFDGDGNLDLMISSVGLRDQLRYFRNNGDGTFTEKTKEAGLPGVVGGLNLIHADYNNDGWPDVLVLRGAWYGKEGHHPNSLLRNNGNGTFDDVTEEAGLLSFHPTQTAVWFDFNRDGWLDLYIGNESTPGDPNPCELYRNNGDGTFTEIAASVGVANLGYVKAVAVSDYNNDLWPDLYLSQRGEPNVLFRNDGPQNPDKSPKGAWRFTNVAIAAGVTEPITSFATWFFDYDNDGWLDLFVNGYRVKNVGDVAADCLGLTHQAERARLYHNNHDGTFTDATKAAHLDRVLLAMAGNFGDLDNDGFLDFYLGTGDPDLSMLIPNRMFRNVEGKFFQDVTTSGGFGHLQKGHGIVFGDIDNDGDQDIYEVIGGAYAGDNYRNVLFENPGHGNHWINLKLEGVESNRSALAARIKVVVNARDGDRMIYRTVGTGGSFGSSPLRQQIGLGQATSIRSVEITWPRTGKVQVIGNLALDQCYKIREGEAQPTLIQLKPFKLPHGMAHPQHQHQ